VKLESSLVKFKKYSLDNDFLFNTTVYFKLVLFLEINIHHGWDRSFKQNNTKRYFIICKCFNWSMSQKCFCFVYKLRDYVC